jgi:large subunit ribosomal protein L7/L12
MTNLTHLVEELSKLTILEASELVKTLEEKWGVSASAPVAVAAAPVSGGAAPATAEKTSFDISLTDFGANKINVIKAVKEITGLGLAESKTLVEAAPKVLKEGISKEEADKIKASIEAAGGKVEVK